MRNELIRSSVTAFVAIMLLLGGYAAAADEAVDATAPAATAAPAAAAEIINPICPVMQGKVNPDLFVEYKGKKVYFCCPACIDEFNADPEKYIASLPQFATDAHAGHDHSAHEGHEQNNLSKLIVPGGIVVFAVLAFFAFRGSKKPQPKS